MHISWAYTNGKPGIRSLSYHLWLTSQQLCTIFNKSFFLFFFSFSFCGLRGLNPSNTSVPSFSDTETFWFLSLSLSIPSQDCLRLLSGWDFEDTHAPGNGQFSPKLLEFLNPFTVKEDTEVTYFLKKTTCVFGEAVAASFPEANRTFWYILSKCHNSREKHLSPESWSSSWPCLFAEIIKLQIWEGTWTGWEILFNSVHLAEGNEEACSLGAASDVSINVIKY